MSNKGNVDEPMLEKKRTLKFAQRPTVQQLQEIHQYSRIGLARLDLRTSQCLWIMYKDIAQP